MSELARLPQARLEIAPGGASGPQKVRLLRREVEPEGTEQKTQEKRALERGLSLGVAISAAAQPLLEHVRMPVLLYYPLERRWSLELDPSALAMEWYGRVLVSFGLGAFACFAVLGIARYRNAGRPRAQRSPALLLAAVLALSMAVSAWQLSHRTFTPRIETPDRGG